MNKEYIKLINKAQYEGSLSHWEDSLNYYKEAFKITCIVDDYLDYSLVLFNLELFDESRDKIKELLKEYNNYYKIYYYLGITYSENDDDFDYNEAIYCYLKAIELTNEIDVLSDIYFKLGNTYDNLNEIDNAINAYNKSNEYKNNFDSYLNLSRIYEFNNKLDLALNCAKLAYSLNNSRSDVCYNLGVIYSRLNKIEESIKYYKEEITKDDFYPYAYYNLSLLEKDYNHNLNESLYYIRKALELLKDDCNVWYNAACIYVLLNDYNNATDCFYASILINPKIKDYMRKDLEIKEYIESNSYSILLNKVNCK